MAIKIDLGKAYDCLNCSFVVDTLWECGIPERIVSIVANCISTSHMRVLWNWEALDEFRPSRGVCQGDPVSPYLFVLFLECLIHLITYAVEHNAWKPI